MELVELQPVLLAAGLGLAFILLALKKLRKGSGDKQKQGGYGKVKTHSPSLWSSVIRPYEFYALLGYLFAGKGSSATLCSDLPYAAEEQVVKDDAILHKLLKKGTMSLFSDPLAPTTLPEFLSETAGMVKERLK